MDKKEYLKKIDEVNSRGPYTDTWDSLCEHPTPVWYEKGKFGTVFLHLEMNGIQGICIKKERLKIFTM
jgi:hypothetical protein